MKFYLALWFWGLLSYPSHWLYKFGMPSGLGFISDKYARALMAWDNTKTR